MDYAIISDIHGNLPAFEAVLADSEAHNISNYLFLGDYFRDLPWVNETIELMQKLGTHKNVYAVRGNNETRLRRYREQGHEQLKYEQFGLDKWNFDNISDANAAYITYLPEAICLNDGNCKINLAHSSSIFFRLPKMYIFHSHYMRYLQETTSFTRNDYNLAAKEAILSRPDVMVEINSLEEGVYLFGHNHMQFNLMHDNKLFINPGSCGISLDGDTSASYSILSCTANGCKVEERRVIYDINKALDYLNKSSLTTKAPGWALAIKQHLLTGFDHMAPLYYHAKELAEQNGEVSSPINDPIWRQAVESWDVSKPVSKKYFI